MKLWKKILIVVAIILCVGLLAGSIARTAVKPVTVGRSGSGSNSSTPAATDPAEPQIEYVNDGKIYLLVQDDTEDSGYNVAVYEDDVLLEPLYISPAPAPSQAKGGNSDPDPTPMKVYRVTPGSSLVRFVPINSKSGTKGGDVHEDVEVFDLYEFNLPLYFSDEFEDGSSIYGHIYDTSSIYLGQGYPISSSVLFMCITLPD